MDSRAIKSRMSSARQAVHRAESLTGFGKRPDLTPSHQQVFLTGIMLSTCGNRKKPVKGISCMLLTCRNYTPLEIVYQTSGTMSLGKWLWRPVCNGSSVGVR